MSSSAHLLKRFSGFLSSPNTARTPLLGALQVFRDRGWHTHVFGGTIRDLMIGGLSAVPRDVDLVVDHCSMSDIANAFEPFVKRYTRFGGLHLDIKGWKFDVWPLRETWAFRNGLVSHPSFYYLPQTTFLNVEAVVVELDGAPGYWRAVYDNGFLESLERRVLDINLEENPFPKLCVARSLVMATKLDFQIDTALTHYIYKHSPIDSIDELIAIQMEHYGTVRLNRSDVNRCLECIYRAVEYGHHGPLKLPSLAELRSGQLPLPLGA